MKGMALGPRQPPSSLLQVPTGYGRPLLSLPARCSRGRMLGQVVEGEARAQTRRGSWMSPGAETSCLSADWGAGLEPPPPHAHPGARLWAGQDSRCSHRGPT